jgi:serine/threonine-protein kinase
MSRMLGRYELLEQLGEGGMGAVYLARLTGAAGFEKLCIVKTVLPSIAKDAEFVSRFQHEGRLLTQLAHGNIAQVLDLNEADGTYYLALEYVAGVDLARLHEAVRASGHFMPLPMAVMLAAQAAEGLGAAHRSHALDGTPLNIVHRDVSPHNVMVSYEGEVKVIDFGIAKSEARSRHTAQASVMGKLGYMAPEQARGEVVDHRADQYALGIVIWELLSNEAFVKRGTLTEMVVAMANPSARPLAPLRAEVPASLEAVVLKALSPRVEDRFETTDAFAQALLSELSKLGPAPTKPQLGQYVRERCANDFATQRQLLTRVTTQRAIPLDEVVRPGPPVATQPSAAKLATGAATLHARPATKQVQSETLPGGGDAAETSAHRPAPAAAPVALNTGELRAAAPSKMPMLIMGAVIVVLLLVIALISLSPGGGEGRGEGKPTRTPEPVAVVDAGPAPVAVVDAGTAIAPSVEVAVVDAGEPVAPPPVEEEQPTLRLVARRTPQSWILANGNATTWTACTMTVPGQRVAKLGSVKKGSSMEVPLGRFALDKTARVLERQARVDCAEGFGLVKAP